MRMIYATAVDSVTYLSVNIIAEIQKLLTLFRLSTSNRVQNINKIAEIQNLLTLFRLPASNRVQNVNKIAEIQNLLTYSASQHQIASKMSTKSLKSKIC